MLNKGQKNYFFLLCSQVKVSVFFLEFFLGGSSIYRYYLKNFKFQKGQIYPDTFS